MVLKTEVAIIRGAVCYNNYFPREHLRGGGAKKSRRDKPRERIHRRDWIAPAVLNHGPTFSALGAVHTH